MESAFSMPSSPVAALGTVTLIIAFVVVAYAGMAGVVGQRTRRPGLVASALHATWAWTGLMFFASSLLVYAFLSHDFRIKYVAHYSATTQPLGYLLTSYWGGLDGSLMFWVWILAIFSSIALYVNRERHRDMLGYVIGTVAAVAVFFLALLLYSKNPFATFLTTPPTEGRELNPLLQNYWMVIHPPSLYIGYVGMTIPFAFCMGALASGRLDDSWLHSIRIWVLIPWFFLGFGLTLGGIWAYEELGWGGYWAWDPVENAGLVPWFTATAFLHSVMIQERRGMLKVWNVVLVITTFFLTIFGTFMTRSGIVQSVHAFGQDNELALLFLIFMSVALVVAFGLLIYRLPALRSANVYESFLSRESAFLLNNILLLGCAFFVLFATMFPTISEYVMQERLSVGPPFFNYWMVPLGLLLLFLMGAGPLLAWRFTSDKRLFDQFLFPVAALAATIGLLAVLWAPSRVMTPIFSGLVKLPMPLTCFGLIAFTFASIGQELVRGTRVRRAQTGSDWLTAAVGILFSKRRKYGGYIVHAGIAVMFFGFIGKAYQQEKSVTVSGLGETWTVDNYTFKYEDLQFTANENREMSTAKVTVARDGEVVHEAYPARWHYLTSGETTTEVDIFRQGWQDVYLVLNGFESDSKQANFTVYLNPLVNFVWLGFAILAVGTAVCLFPMGLLGFGKKTSVLLLIGLGALAAGGRARADTTPMPGTSQHVIVHGVVDDDAGAPPLAKRLWSDLVCLCQGCQRESLSACRCGYAKQERERIVGMLAGVDLSTKEKEEAAYRQVVAAYVARYGGNHVLNVPPDTAFNKLAWAVPYAAFGAAVVLIGLVVRGWVRRGQGQAAAPTVATGPAAGPGSEVYEDKLDDELDEMD
jgi:cytochrome c-type biogenesis protein CcmF